MLKVAFVKKLAVSGTCLRLLSSLGQHESVIVSRRGRDCQIGLVQLNKPESHNALSPNLIDQLASSVEELDADASIRCLVLTGSEKVFSVGADVKHLASLEPSDVATEDVLHKWDVLASVKKPLIAVVNGPALGGGCELAMMCDVIYAGENARFGQPEIKLATIPGVGGTQRLIRAIGKSRAMEIILSGTCPIPAHL
uniref:Enoyl-CoA hydratase n=1 Tax=Mesocestoides corti TaxID=53468 RepID=A0A5K3F7N8_MESCO